MSKTGSNKGKNSPFLFYTCQGTTLVRVVLFEGIIIAFKRGRIRPAGVGIRYLTWVLWCSVNGPYTSVLCVCENSIGCHTLINNALLSLI